MLVGVMIYLFEIGGEISIILFVEIRSFDFVDDLIVVFEDNFFGFVLVVYFFCVFEVGGVLFVKVLENVILVVEIIVDMFWGVILDGC